MTIFVALLSVFIAYWVLAPLLSAGGGEQEAILRRKEEALGKERLTLLAEELDLERSLGRISDEDYQAGKKALQRVQDTSHSS